MVSPTTRAGKGSELTWAEVDANFTDIAAALNLLIPTSTSYSTTIVFTGNKYMPKQTVSGAIAFTADGTSAVEGAQVTVDLVANGTNVPTFSGFREWDGSSGYVNTLNVRNCITFFWRGGTAYYSINQQYGAAADPTTATAITLTGPSSGVVSTASSNFTVGANGTLSSSVTVTPSSGGGGGTFSPTSVTISSGTPTATFTYTPASTGAKTISVTNSGGLTNPSSITYTVSSGATAPGAPTGLTLGTATSTTQPLTWTAPASDGGSSITDYVIQYALAGSGSWSTFSDGTSTTASTTVTGLTASTSYDYRVAAVNAIGTGSYSSTATGSTTSATSSIVRATALTQLTESGDGTSGWNYTTNSALWAYCNSLCDKHLPAGADGYIQFTIGFTPSGTTKAVGVGFKINSSGDIRFETCTYGLYAHSTYGKIASGAVTTDTGRSVLNGDIVRYERSGSNMLIKVSSDGGSSFTTINTTTVGSLDQPWYFGLFGDGTGAVLSNIRHSGFVA